MDFNKDTFQNCDDLWYIRPNYDILTCQNEQRIKKWDTKILNQVPLEDVLGIYKANKSPSLSPSSSIPTLSPNSPENYLSKGGLSVGIPSGIPTGLSNMIPNGMGYSNWGVLGPQSKTPIKSQLKSNLLSLDDLTISDSPDGQSSYTSRMYSSAPIIAANKTPNIIVGGTSDRPPGVSSRRSSSPPLISSKLGWTRSSRAQSFGTIGDRRKII